MVTTEAEQQYLRFLEAWLIWRRTGHQERPATPFSGGSTLVENSFWWAQANKIDRYKIKHMLERRFEEDKLNLAYPFLDKVYDSRVSELGNYWKTVGDKTYWLNRKQLDWVESEVTRLGGRIPASRFDK